MNEKELKVVDNHRSF